MQTYAFTVLTENELDVGIVEKVYAACPDATATSESGRLAIAFDRQADSLDDAIRSALNQLGTLQIAITAVTLDAESLTVLQ